MLTRTPPRYRPFAALLAGIAISMQAQAAPATTEYEGRTDSLLRLVIERGLVPADAAGTSVRQVRDMAADMVLMAYNFLDRQYRMGGNTAEEGFDCSGFVRFLVQNSMGLLLPRRSDEQAHAKNVVPVEREELQPGDLVFFNTLRQSFSHVGIYVGDGKFIHSPRAGFSVRVEDMRKDYWTSRFNGARRVQPGSPQR